MASFFGNLASGLGSGLLQYAAIQQKGTMDAIRQASLEKRWMRQDAMEDKRMQMQMDQNTKADAHRDRVFEAQTAENERASAHRDRMFNETERSNKANEANTAKLREIQEAQTKATASANNTMTERQFAEFVMEQKNALTEQNRLLPPDKQLTKEQIHQQAVSSVRQLQKDYRGETSKIPANLQVIIDANPERFRGMPEDQMIAEAQKAYNFFNQGGGTPKPTPVQTPTPLNPLEGEDNQRNFRDYIQGTQGFF